MRPGIAGHDPRHQPVHVLGIPEQARRRGIDRERIDDLEGVGIATMAACVIVCWAVTVARPGSSAWRQVAVVHTLSSVAFSIAHVGLMVPLRIAIHALAGERYRFMAWDWLYEYRKDAVAYLILGAIFWYFTRPNDAPRADATPESHAAPPYHDPAG